MPRYTVLDNQSGRKVTFDWNGQAPPAESDMEEVFAAAEHFPGQQKQKAIDFLKGSELAGPPQTLTDDQMASLLAGQSKQKPTKALEFLHGKQPPAVLTDDEMEAVLRQQGRSASGQVDVSQILKDPNFLGLPQGEQQKVLQRVDPNFAGLPEAEQVKVLGRIGGQNAPQSDDSLRDGRTPGPMPESGKSSTPGLPEGVTKFKAGKQWITTHPDVGEAFMLANQEFMRETGRPIIVNSSYRTREQQQKLYDELQPKGAAVAKPGHSMHEKGQALDIQNWEEAAPYLKKHGLVNPLANDRNHFQLGTPQISSPPSLDGMQLADVEQRTGRDFAGDVAPIVRHVGAPLAAAGGAIIGSGVTPIAGTAAGGALGYGAVNQLANALEEYAGTRQRPSTGEALAEAGRDLVVGGATSLGVPPAAAGVPSVAKAALGAGLTYGTAKQAERAFNEGTGRAQPQNEGEAISGAIKDVAFGTAMGAAVPWVLGKVSGGSASGIAAEKQLNAKIEKAIEKSIRPSVEGQRTYAQASEYNRKAVKAVKTIVSNKDKLNLTDEFGEPTGKLPENLKQFSQAIGQAKSAVFEQYNSMTTEAGKAGSMTMETAEKTAKTIIQQGKDTARDVLKNIKTAKRIEKETVSGIISEAKQTGEIYRDRSAVNARIAEARKQAPQKAKEGLQQAKDEAARARAEAEQKAREAMNAARQGAGIVNLQTVVKELRTISSNKILNDLAPETVRYAEARAAAFENRGWYSTAEAQEAIQTLNNSLENFYRNPSYDTASKAYVDSLSVNRLRKGLDGVIEGATGPGYQNLKNVYGSLKAIERDVNRRAVVDARKNVKGLLDFTDVFSGHQVVKGILSMNPATVGAGVASNFISRLYKRLNDPNRIVKNLFQDVDKAFSESRF